MTSDGNNALLPANVDRSRDLFHEFVHENVFLRGLYNKSLKDCSLGKQLILFPSAPPWETLRFSGNKINSFSREQSLSVNYYPQFRVVRNVSII